MSLIVLNNSVKRVQRIKIPYSIVIHMDGYFGTLKRNVKSLLLDETKQTVQVNSIEQDLKTFTYLVLPILWNTTYREGY